MIAPRLWLLAMPGWFCLSAALAQDTGTDRPVDPGLGVAPLTGTQAEQGRCLLEALKDAPAEISTEQLRAWCGLAESSKRQRNEDALRGRLALEEFTQFNPFVLTPHRRNYILPVTHWSNPNWNDPARQDEPVDAQEAKFQFSVKLPLATDLWRDSTLYAAFSVKSFWQVYNRRLSSPFRESNYSPEIFVGTPASGRVGPMELELVAWGYQHESNGQDLPLSRSWDRLFLQFIMRHDDYYVSLRPWWRIPEPKRDDPQDRKGDDNPDIERYMGHFELSVARPFGNHVAELMIRNNLRSDNKGAARFDYSFPMTRRLKGLFQIFTGYGDSLISYDEYQTRVGVGILLTDTL